MEDEYLYGDESEYGTDADTDECEEDEGKPASEPVILPCRTLSQLWKVEIHMFEADERIGSHLRSDICLYTKSNETENSILALSSRIAQQTIFDAIYTYIVANANASSREAIFRTETALKEKKY